MRKLTDGERGAIVTLAARLKSEEERNQLLANLDNSAVGEAAPDGSMLAFDIAGYERPAERGRWQYRGKDGFSVEGIVRDADRTEMDVMLLADSNHRVMELEIVRYHPGSVSNPDWSTFRLK